MESHERNEEMQEEEEEEEGKQHQQHNYKNMQHYHHFIQQQQQQHIQQLQPGGLSVAFSNEKIKVDETRGAIYAHEHGTASTATAPALARKGSVDLDAPGVNQIETSHRMDLATRSTVLPTRIIWRYGGTQVHLCGSFTRWIETIQMQPMGTSLDENCLFGIDINLPLGYHQFKFIVDGKWRHDDAMPVVQDPLGNLNNW